MIKFENNPWQYSTDHEINHLPVVKKREMLQSNLKNLTTITSFLKKKKKPLNSYVWHFLIPANLPISFMDKINANSMLIVNKLKTSSLDTVAPSVLVS